MDKVWWLSLPILNLSGQLPKWFKSSHYCPTSRALCKNRITRIINWKRCMWPLLHFSALPLYQTWLTLIPLKWMVTTKMWLHKEIARISAFRDFFGNPTNYKRGKGDLSEQVTTLKNQLPKFQKYKVWHSSVQHNGISYGTLTTSQYLNSLLELL